MRPRIMLSKQRIKNEQGASLVEYSLLVALISVVSIAGISSFGQNVSQKFEDQAKIIEEAGLSSANPLCSAAPPGVPLPPGC